MGYFFIQLVFIIIAGPFLLTKLLLDILKSASPSRIVTIASEIYGLAGKLKFDDILMDEKSFGKMKAYPQSKLCNILFSRELSKRLEGI